MHTWCFEHEGPRGEGENERARRVGELRKGTGGQEKHLLPRELVTHHWSLQTINEHNPYMHRIPSWSDMFTWHLYFLSDLYPEDFSTWGEFLVKVNVGLLSCQCPLCSTELPKADSQPKLPGLPRKSEGATAASHICQSTAGGHDSTDEEKKSQKIYSKMALKISRCPFSRHVFPAEDKFLGINGCFSLNTTPSIVYLCGSLWVQNSLQALIC